MTPLGPEIKITMTRAEHSSELVWKNPATGKDELPIHYGTFPVLRGTPEEYVKALGQTPTKVHAIQPGDKLAF